MAFDWPDGVRLEGVIRAWLTARIAELAEIDEEEVDSREPFSSFGLSSVAAAGLAGDLEEWLGLTLPAALAYDYPSVEQLARHLAERLREPEAARRPQLDGRS